jgi:hypothetical protein
MAIRETSSTAYSIMLKQKKSLIIKQISAAKSKVLKYLDEIEERLIIEVESVQGKNEEKINKEKLEICQLTSIEFLTSFEAESKGKTDSQDLWLSERQALQHTTSC